MNKPLFQSEVTAGAALMVFAFFHLNLAFSSIEEERRGEVIARCYWPLLKLAERVGPPVDAWGPILKTPGVTFVNLQYGDCAAELKRMQERFGVTVEVIPGLDLRDDIDGAAALSAALDLVISAPTAAAATAASVGAEVWFLTAGRTWPQLGTDEFPWYADTKVISPEKFGDWSDVMFKAGARLAGYIAK